ncbi:MAG TPA: FtsH protease activity modulator HflK [Thermoanaerobaculia bacterium]|nr:FtsH protease activity modulator HflK [Thermoanaerobaculia bacterium]
MAFDRQDFPKGLELPDFARWRERGSRWRGPGGGALRWIVLAAALLLVLTSVFYTVDPEEVAVVVRLGKYVRQEPPGLHLKLPLGIERVWKVPVLRQLKAEFGFRTVAAGIRSEFVSQGYTDESSMLSGDLNAAVVEWVVQYRISNAENYQFRVRGVEETFRAMNEAVVRTVVGDRTVNEVITVGRQEIEDEVRTRLQALCDEYQTGIRVDRIVLQTVNPPDPVKPSFNEVNQAEQEKERLINEAQAQYNQVIPRAEGEALRAIQEAEGYALNRVNQAQGDASRFRALYQEYRGAPEVTRRRIYLETLAEILPKAGRKLVLDDQLEGLMPLLSMDGTPLPLVPREEAAR